VVRGAKEVGVCVWGVKVGCSFGFEKFWQGCRGPLAWQFTRPLSPWLRWLRACFTWPRANVIHSRHVDMLVIEEGYLYCTTQPHTKQCFYSKNDRSYQTALLVMRQIHNFVKENLSKHIIPTAKLKKSQMTVISYPKCAFEEYMLSPKKPRSAEPTLFKLMVGSLVGLVCF